jgi:hypothetical protein
VARRAAWLREPNRRPSQRRRRQPRRRSANPLRRRSKAARSIGFETVDRLCHTSRRCQRAGGGDAIPRSDAGSGRQEGVGETGFKLPRHDCLRRGGRRDPRSTRRKPGSLIPRSRRRPQCIGADASVRRARFSRFSKALIARPTRPVGGLRCGLPAGSLALADIAATGAGLRHGAPQQIQNQRQA